MPETEAKNTMVSFRTTTYMWDGIKRAAKLEGIDPSEWLRKVAAGELRKVSNGKRK